MVLSHLQPGQSLPSATANALIDAYNRAALIGVVPTSVAGTGVSVSGNGQVTFTAAPSVSVNGVFTSTYDNYRIVWNSPTQTQNSDLYMRMRAAGTDDTTSDYSFMRGWDGGTAAARTVAMVTATSSWIISAGASASQTNDGYLDIWGPALAAAVTGLSQSAVHQPSPNMYTTTTNLYNSSTNPFDGFTIYPASGSITGVLRVYGYNNLI